ncbi:MAG: hypothetical protein GY940_47390 [bacterium]|nr:hypothetical protein [bacterium]
MTKEIPFKNAANEVSVLKDPIEFNIQYAVIEQIQINDSGSDFRYHLVVVRNSRIDTKADFEMFGEAKYEFWKSHKKNSGKDFTETVWHPFIKLTRNWIETHPLVSGGLYKTRHAWHKARAGKKK